MLTRRGRSTVDDDALRAAVGSVADPELHRGIGELGMLRSASADRRGTAHVEVALTTSACPLRDRLRTDITAAASAVPGVADVRIDFTTLSEGERMRLAQRLRERQPLRLGSDTLVYAVASGKGGVGKSSVAANLAVALARQGKRVGLLDADVWGYSVPQLFGVRRNPVALKGLMLPVEAYGVRLMSVGFLVDEGQPVVWRGPMLHKALEQFLADVHWGELDVLLLDLPPGTGDVTLSLMELLPQAALLAVTTPQPSAQTVASRAGELAREQGMPIAGVVENMSTLVCGSCGEKSALFGTGGGQRLADELGADLLAQIPLDLELRSAGDVGVPVVAGAPTAPSSVALSGLAERLPVVRRSLAGVALPLSVVG
jgi:ATP-binding protein involved in chromosome partitioning